MILVSNIEEEIPRDIGGGGIHRFPDLFLTVKRCQNSNVSPSWNRAGEKDVMNVGQTTNEQGNIGQLS